MRMHCLGDREVTYVRHRKEKREQRREDGTLISISYVSVPEASVTCMVRLYVDARQILDRLATRAARNKTGRAVVAGGAVVVRRITPKKEVPYEVK